MIWFQSYIHKKQVLADSLNKVLMTLWKYIIDIKVYIDLPWQVKGVVHLKIKIC